MLPNPLLTELRPLLAEPVETVAVAPLGAASTVVAPCRVQPQLTRA